MRDPRVNPKCGDVARNGDKENLFVLYQTPFEVHYIGPSGAFECCTLEDWQTAAINDTHHVINLSATL